ncbi:hypothetical protein [Streptomyces sp. NPDC049879]|uniref:hypothetical protein n=1 Tax=Streptomyces sp. NPDC049879 TaxID=3365598 RepID=UPI0037A78E5F
MRDPAIVAATPTTEHPAPTLTGPRHPAPDPAATTAARVRYGAVVRLRRDLADTPADPVMDEALRRVRAGAGTEAA